MCFHVKTFSGILWVELFHVERFSGILLVELFSCIVQV